jgi:hypothetical protein
MKCLFCVMDCHNKYCSLQCMQDYELIIWIQKWKSGNARVSLHNSTRLKRALISLYGEKCSRCGWCERHPVTQKVPVELEHKDGNYENNSFENVCLLCPNCHSLTLTFRALNKGNGRAYRRKVSVAQYGSATTL